MNQLCNLVYGRLAAGRTEPGQMEQLDMDLAPPEEKELRRNRMNQQSLAALGVMKPMKKGG